MVTGCLLIFSNLTSAQSIQPAAGPEPAPATAAAPTPTKTDTIELLGPGDSVRINVFQNPDLNLEARISAKGSVSIPLIGEVVLQGLTPSAAEARIAQRLKEGGFVNNPQVNVNLVQLRSRQVSVLGLVSRPGKYPMDDYGSKLVDVIALAGGVVPNAADNVTLVTTRNGKTEKLEIDLPAMFRTGAFEQNIEIVSGDILFVQRAPQFYIYGEVQRPGAYRIEPNMTVIQALALAGGVTLRGTQKGLMINRHVQPGKVETIEARLTDFVRTDDVIFANESLF
ncbi:MAG: polysaccharide export protein EpsE [Betaproteobacteria bacterium]